jgi:hypothetical protein
MNNIILSEHPVYSSWAGTENEHEKSKTNHETYQWLIENYKINTKWSIEHNKLNMDDFDIVYEGAGTGYGTSSYKIIKNILELPNEYLALLCDHGNLCFGYALRSGNICIYTD